MNFKVKDFGENIYITAYRGTLSAKLTEWTSLQVKNVIGRDLSEGERFYWLNTLRNESGKKGEGTRLLLYIIKILQKKNATIGLIASPLCPEYDSILSLEKRLTGWYLRHGFQDVGVRYPVLVHESGRVSDEFRVSLI